MLMDPTSMLLRSRQDESAHMNNLCMPDVEVCLGMCDKAEIAKNLVVEPATESVLFPDESFDDILLQRAKVTQTIKENHGGLHTEAVRTNEPASQTRPAIQTRPAGQTKRANRTKRASQTKPATELAKRTTHEKYDFEFTYKQPCCSIQ